jgi:hypothetical protein
MKGTKNETSENMRSNELMKRGFAGLKKTNLCTIAILKMRQNRFAEILDDFSRQNSSLVL